MHIKEYKYYCNTEQSWVYEWAESEPIICANNAAHDTNPYSISVNDENISMSRRSMRIAAGETISSGAIVSVNGYDELTAGFSMPTKVVFEDKSASFIASDILSTVTISGITTSVFAIVYCNNMGVPVNNVGNCVICTVVSDGTNPASIVYNTTATFTGSNILTGSVVVLTLSATDFAVIYRDATASNGKITFGVVSGSGASATVSFTANTTFNTVACGDQTNSIVATLLGSSRLFIAYRDTGNANKGSMITGALSGTGLSRTIVFGVKAQFSTVATATSQYSICLARLDDNRVVIFYDTLGTSLSAVIVTVTGTTMAIGTVNNIFAPDVIRVARDIGCVRIPGTTQVLFAYRQSINNISQGYLVVATCSSAGASPQVITYGTVMDYSTDTGIQSPNFAMFPDGKFILSYINGSDKGQLELRVGSVSAGIVTLADTNAIIGASGSYNYCIAIDNNQAMLFYRDVSSFNTGCGTYVTLSDTLQVDAMETHGRYPIGVASESGVGGEVISVTVSGLVNSAGLKPSTCLYAHGDGSLTTSLRPIDNSYTPIKAGNALSTDLYILSMTY